MNTTVLTWQTDQEPKPTHAHAWVPSPDHLSANLMTDGHWSWQVASWSHDAEGECETLEGAKRNAEDAYVNLARGQEARQSTLAKLFPLMESDLSPGADPILPKHYPIATLGPHPYTIARTNVILATHERDTDTTHALLRAIARALVCSECGGQGCTRLPLQVHEREDGTIVRIVPVSDQRCACRDDLAKLLEGAS